MYAKPARELPRTFDGVEIGTVRGQKKQLDPLSVFSAPLFMKSCMMILRIVDHDDCPASGSTGKQRRLGA